MLRARAIWSNLQCMRQHSQATDLVCVVCLHHLGARYTIAVNFMHCWKYHFQQWKKYLQLQLTITNHNPHKWYPARVSVQYPCETARSNDLCYYMNGRIQASAVSVIIMICRIWRHATDCISIHFDYTFDQNWAFLDTTEAFTAAPANVSLFVCWNIWLFHQRSSWTSTLSSV